MPKTNKQEQLFLFTNEYINETIFVYKKIEKGNYWYKLNNTDEWKEMISEYELNIEIESFLGRENIWTFKQARQPLHIYQCKKTKHFKKIERFKCFKTQKWFYRENLFNRWNEMKTKDIFVVKDDCYEYINEDKS